MDFRAELATAAQTGDVARLRVLLDGARDLANMPDEAGYTALHYAAYNGRSEVVTYLLEIGADVGPSSMDPLRNQPVHAAASNGHLDVVRQLLEAGADPNAEQTGAWTPLHVAAQRGHEAVVRLLLERGAEPGRRSAAGTTPLGLAREKGHDPIVTLLAPFSTDA